MEFYPITPIFAALLGLSLISGTRGLMILLAAMIPFGMLAVISLPSLGGLSLLAVNLTAAALVGLGGLSLVARMMQHRDIRIDAATIALIAFAAYSTFSAIVLVRLFAGEIMVFSLSRGDLGVKVSALFSWGKVWLTPSSSNLSQAAYIILACGLFIAASSALARHGAAFGARCFAIAATINLALGILDLAALDSSLAFIRTANYSLANEASVYGIPRIIGGYSESASFGSANAMFFAYFASATLNSGRVRDALLAMGSGIFAVLALSSTGLVAIFVVTLVLIARGLAQLPKWVTPAQLMTWVMVFCGLAIAFGVSLIFTDLADVIGAVVTDLILDKSQSASGLERKAWALGGLEAFVDTWGLGVGAGSIRSNGLLFVLLGSVGLPGTLAFLAFLWHAFGGRAAPGQEATLSNARMAALAILVSMSLSATVLDPGTPLILVAAIAVTARKAQLTPAQTAPVSPRSGAAIG